MHHVAIETKMNLNLNSPVSGVYQVCDALRHGVILKKSYDIVSQNKWFV